MRAVLLAAGLAWGNASWADGSGGDWFTVTGDPSQAQQNTVQVDPVAVTRAPLSRTMNIRVNRVDTRRSWSGEPYRSYNAQVQVRCSEWRAEFVSIQLYEQPLWEGRSERFTFDEGKRPPLRLSGMEPNPLMRIIRAACPEARPGPDRVMPP